MSMGEYLQNRAAFPVEELAKHRGERIAWNPDGTRLVAASRNPAALDDPIRAVRETDEEGKVGYTGTVTLLPMNRELGSLEKESET